VYFRQIEAQLGAGVQDIRGSDRSDTSKVKIEMNCTYYQFYSIGCMHKKTFHITVKVLIFAASNFHGFSQLDKFVGTFFRVFLIAQKQKNVLFGQSVY